MPNLPKPSKPCRATAIFCQDYRVYLDDTDAGGIVYHANHLKFFERCRRDWLRDLGLPSYFFTPTLSERPAVSFVVQRAEVSYLAPLLLDDLISVTVQQYQLNAASLQIEQAIFAKDGVRADRLLSQATLTLACVQQVPQTGQLRMVRLPRDFIAKLAI